MAPFPGPQVLGIRHRQGEVPPFLHWRQAGLLDGAGLTVFLAHHVLLGPASVCGNCPGAGFCPEIGLLRISSRIPDHDREPPSA